MIGSEITVWAPCLAFVLAVVAAVGYIFGRRRNPVSSDSAWRELKQAKAVISELEGVSKNIRQMLATHQTSVTEFQEKMAALSRQSDADGWQELAAEAERMLAPTMQLSTDMAVAYDEIRKQTNLLMSFTEVRTDPLTGLNNRRAMEETLKSMFAMKARYNTEFSIAIIDIDQFKRLNDEHGHLFGDKSLQQVAEALNKAVRETDSVARFGGEEFVVIMPHTDLEGSCVFAERFRRQSADDLPVTVSIGVTAALPDDSIQTLLTRADAALYSAKSSGRNCVFRHTGQKIELVKILPARFEDQEQPDQIELATSLR